MKVSSGNGLALLTSVLFFTYFMKISYSTRQILPVVLLFFALPLTMAAQSSLYRSWGVRVVNSSLTQLEIEYRPVVQGFDTSLVAGIETTILPKIIGAEVFADAKPGEPSVLGITIPICIPSEKGVKIGSITVQQVKAHKGLMTPVAPVEDGFTQTIDPAAYSVSNKDSWAEVRYGGIVRDRHLAFLRCTAARYDGLTRSVLIPEVIRVVVTFTPDSFFPASQPRSNDDPGIMLNARETSQWRITPSVPMAKRSVISEASNGTWLRIGVESEGLYSISAQTLQNNGIDITPDQVSTIKVYGYGGKELPEKVSVGMNNELIEQPIIVKTGSSGELQSVEFYGAAPQGFEYNANAKGIEKFEHYINHYSRKNYYLLTFGGGAGTRAQYEETPSGSVVHTPQYYTARTFFEEELFNPFTPGSDRRWFGRIANRDIPNTYTTMLPNVVKKQGQRIFYRYDVVNKVDSPAQFTVSENGINIGSSSCRGVSTGNHEFAYSVMDTASIAANSLKDDRSVLQFLYTTTAGSQSASGYIDWFEIHYPREFVALDNQIEFFTNPSELGITEYTVNGFSGEIVGFDVTNRAAPRMIRNLSSTGGIYLLRTNNQASAPKRFYIAGARKTPASIETVNMANLRGNFANTDVILITHKDLLPSALVYKEYRESQGELTVSIVTTEQIFDEFAAGVPDPTAVRDFLAFTLKNWTVKPRYALLWGDGHYDYKNISTDEPIYVPTYQTLNSDGSFDAVQTTSMIEDYFARISGDDSLIDIALGRIPIRSVEQGLAVIDKIKHYETQSSIDLWRTKITLIADDVWTTEGPFGDSSVLHTPQSEDLSRDYIPSSLYQKKIYLPEYPTENIPGGRRKPRVTEDMVNSINRGTLILNWIGHGNPRVWAHEQIFDKDVTIPLMTNRDKLFFLVAATCDFGRIDDPARQSGAEELFTSTIGGAIGVFSASRTVYSSSNAALSKKFYSHLFDNKNGEYPRLGDAVLLTKLEASDKNDQKFFLLGDPTLRLLLPPHTIRITSIDSVDVPSDILPQLKALSTVRITGDVLAADSTIDTAFNGTVVLNLYDSDIYKEVKDLEIFTHKYFVFGGLLNVSADSVRNGKFTATMVVPQDISFSDQPGRLNAYAFSPTTFAKGNSREFTIGGVDTTAVNDNRGPSISVYMDTYTFRSGDLVKPIPELIVDLYDETGINATGLGIGHDIEAWIDDSPNSIRLTRDFTISLEDFRRGTAIKELFDLKPGTHRIRVRAWDVFNNFSEVETYFRIAGGQDELIVDEIFNYPNPFSEQTTIAFRHNQLEILNSKVAIYSIDGKLVRTLQQPITTRSAAVLWDGRNEDGSYLPNGVYLYKLQLSSGNGLYREVEGKLVINR